MKFALSTLMLATAILAIAFASLAHPNDFVLQLLRLILIALGCTALSVAVNCNGKRRRIHSVFGIFAIVLLSLNAGPESLGTLVNSLFNHEFVADDPFTYNFTILSITRVWFAFAFAILAASIAACPVFSRRDSE